MQETEMRSVPVLRLMWRRAEGALARRDA